MDAVRILSLTRAVAPAVEGKIFSDIFLDLVKKKGRLFEPLLGLRYNLSTRKLFKDIDVATKLFARGKLSLIPSSVRDRRGIKDIFSRASKERGK